MNKKNNLFMDKMFTYIKHKWKKILSLCFVFFAIIFLNYYTFKIAYQGNDSNSKKYDKTDTIVIGTHNLCHPFVFVGSKKESISSSDQKSFLSTATGELVSGSDIFLLRDIAKNLNKKLVIKVFDFPGLIASLQNNQVDAIVGSLDITDERLEKMEVIPYTTVPLALLIRSDNTIVRVINKDGHKDGHVVDENIENNSELSLSELKRHDNEKIKLSAVNGSSHDKVEKFSNYDNIFPQMINKEDTMTCIQALNKGKKEDNSSPDAFIMEWPTIEKIISSKENKDKFKGFKLTDEDLKLRPLGLFFNKVSCDHKLKEEIEKAMKVLINIPDTKGRYKENPSTEKKDNYFEKYKDETETAYRYITQEQATLKPQDNNTFFTFISTIFKSLPSYKIGFFVSLTVAVNSLIIGFMLSLIFFSIKISVLDFKGHKNFLFYLKKLCAGVISILNNIFESVPMIVLALLFYNALTSERIDFFRCFQDAFTSTFYVAIIVLSLNTALNFVNIMLNHNKFLDKGQIEAAYALGLNQKQVFWEIVFVQVLRRTLPSIKNQFIMNIKETAFFNIIGLVNLLWIAQRNISKTYDIFLPFIVVTLIYLVVVGIIKIFSKYQLLTKYLKWID